VLPHFAYRHPGDLIGKILKGKKAVTILERLDQPLAIDLPLIREIRTTFTKCYENGQFPKSPPYPEYAVYNNTSDAPALYSGSFGMGSRDLQPEGIIGAIENMLPDGRQQKQFYLSIDFIRDEAFTPKQQIYQQTIEDSYPNVKKLSVRGSENPNLMPEGSVTVRFHSVGGWGAITTGKNLAMTLFDLLGYHIKANPKYGSEKKGQPTTYYLSAASEPIRINCEYFYVNVVLSPDPNVLKHTNALAGLKKGGVFIIQSDLDSPENVWNSIPNNYQKIIVDNNIRVFYVDAFKIAREEATDPELQFRMQGIAFQGAFFAGSPVMKSSGLNEDKLFKAIKDQLQHKFGSKGKRVVEDNLRVVKRGYESIVEIKNKPIGEVKKTDTEVASEPPLPVMLKREPVSKAPSSDIHRFWEQTGNFYLRGLGNDNITDPFIGLSCMPAISAVFRDMTGIRFEHPEWIPENCTACGNCYTVCPDTAIPGLVNDLSEIFDTTINKIIKSGKKPVLLSKAVRQMEGKLRNLLNEASENDSIEKLMATAISDTISSNGRTNEEMNNLKTEFNWFEEAIGDFKFAITRPYYTIPEKKNKNSGGLMSITVNPYTCKGCMECVKECNDEALISVTQTPETIKQLRENWDFWLDLPSTNEKFIRVDDLEEGIGALETILLDKNAYLSLASGDGACMGCSEKTVIHIFTATVEALMQPRIKKLVAYLDELIQKLEKHIQLKLSQNMDVSDSEAMHEILDETRDSDLTLADIASKLQKTQGSKPVDQDWLKRVTQLIAKLKDLKWRYCEGTTGKGRSKLGFINATGCTSVWGSTYPFNPYPFPWANHLFQDSTSMAMGVFEGHMVKMAEGFKAIRMAELELEEKFNPAEHDEFFTYFNWKQFSDEEFLLCPPVVAVGGDGAMYDIGFQNLSRTMMSGKPIKAIILDTQVYSNTGGQACTSGFTGQISDMAQYGNAIQGKQEVRKEIGLIGMAHRTTYVLQSVISNSNHMIEGFIQGLMSKRPALFNLYTTCMPEHGVGDDMGAVQAKMAVESRAYPLFRYDPDKGKTPEECFDLEGNPDIDKDWPSYSLKYLENDKEKSMDVALTFADFAVTESRFRKQFKKAPPETWNDDMILLSEFLKLNEEERQGKFPYIWTTDNKQQLSRLLVSKTLVESTEDRQNFWIMLRALAGIGKESEDVKKIKTNIKKDVINKIASGLMKMADGDSSQLTDFVTTQSDSSSDQQLIAIEPDGEYMAPWIDTEDCTSCDECMKINSIIFEYNDKKKAIIKNANGGSYKDLVKAAEKCTAQAIHPGLPADRSEKDIEKLIKRGEKHN